MHEASVVQGLINMAEKALHDYNMTNPARKAAKIGQIRCDYGLLACFEPQTLRACFEIFSENTIAEGAELILNAAPLACKCQACGHDFKLDRRLFLCPACGSENIVFTGGNGLILQAIEVEEEVKND